MSLSWTDDLPEDLKNKVAIMEKYSEDEVPSDFRGLFK